jgi:hypothetical protein
MNTYNKLYVTILTLSIAVMIYLLIRHPEKYMSGRNDYRYGFVNTNPARRTAGPFDNCSPENFDECVTIA